eukprot:5104137-Prymnesium_polylepis.1
MVQHGAWVTETLQSHILFDAALRNVAARFAPEKLTDREAFRDAAGLQRDKIAVRTKEFGSDRLDRAKVIGAWSSPKKPYPHSRGVAHEIIYGHGSDAPRSPEWRPEGSAGRPSVCNEDEYQALRRIGKAGTELSAARSTVDAVNFGAASAAAEQPPTRRESRQLQAPATPSSLRPRVPCPFHTDAPDEQEAVLHGERPTPRSTAVHLFPSDVRDAMEMKPLAADADDGAHGEARRGGMRQRFELPGAARK